MRVVIAELKQETNTFVPWRTTFADFENWHHWLGADAVAGLADTNSELAGFLDVLAAANIEPVPVLATFAMSGGPVETATFDRLLGELLDGIRAAQADGIDGVLLSLHGAMVAEADDAADATIAAAVRDLIGPDTPLVVTLDLHANLTRALVAVADAVVGFRTSPHIDQRDTGRRGADVMVGILREGVKPAMAFVKIPLNVPASTHMHHLPGPFQRLMQAAAAAEHDRLLSASVLTVQPWLDIAELGFATVAVSDNDPDLAANVASSLAELAWQERDAFMETALVPIDEAIAQAQTLDGPVILSDLADGTGAGSPGDATAVVAALLRADLTKPAYVCIRDETAAAEAIAAGVGATVDLLAGAKRDTVFNQPVRLAGEVVFAGPASFRFSGEGYTGVEMDMGPCAVIRAGQVFVLLLGKSVMTVDPEMYRAVGLEPADAGIVVVKSHIQFRAGYAGIAKHIILLDSPGMSSDHLEALPWKRAPRPWFPLDRDIEFTPEPFVRVADPALAAASRGAG